VAVLAAFAVVSLAPTVMCGEKWRFQQAARPYTDIESPEAGNLRVVALWSDGPSGLSSKHGYLDQLGKESEGEECAGS
jgi:hypothetical protein